MRGSSLLGLVLVGVLVAGCGGKDQGPDDSGRATQLTLVSGDGQSGPVGSALQTPLAVRVTTAAGVGVAGVTVRFAIAAGGGALTATDVSTGSTGEASTVWTLGPLIGASGQRVTATATGLTGSPVTFQASGQVGPPAMIEVVGGNNQRGSLGAPLADSIRVVVKDQFGNPTQGVTLNFQPIAGGGQTSPPSVATDAQGRAATRYTIGSANALENGNQLLIGVEASGVSAVAVATGEFTAGTIAVESGNQQTGSPSSPLLAPVRVVVRTAGGVEVQGVIVQWVVASGGGTVEAPADTTDASGRASIRWTLGPAGGVQGLTASVATLTGGSAAITATALVPAAGVITGLIADQPVAGPPATFAAMVSGLSQGAVGFRSRSGEPVRIARPTGGPSYVPGALIVRFRPAPIGAPAAGAAAFRSGSLATVVAQSMRQRIGPHLGGGAARLQGVSPVIRAARLAVRAGVDGDSLRRALLADPAVESVAPDEIAWSHRLPRSAALASTAPNDPLWPNQSWHYVMVDLPRAWTVTTGSANIIVAVLDAGIRFDHPVFAGNLTTDGYDFVRADSLALCAGGRFDNAGDGDSYDADPTQPSDRSVNATANPQCWEDLEQAGGHGLHVAGTVGAAGNDGVGGTGVNWRVKIRPVRVLGVGGSGGFFDIAQGVLYAAGLPASDGQSGVLTPPTTAARIINMSLGGGCNPTNPSPLRDAIVAATGAGSLVVVSAGNNNDAASRYCPAGYPEPITVAAVGPLGTKASYSNFGAPVDIAAPGGDILPSQPDGTFLVHSAVCDFRVTPCLPGYARYGGTSMAAPHVSGVAALLLAQNPNLTVTGLRDRLLNFAVDVGAAGVDPQYGAGLLNARNSLTQTLSPGRRLFARLLGATTGAVVATTQTSSGNFTFTNIAAGDYWLYAGDDEDGDGLIGLPGRRWGAFGGAHTPTLIRTTPTGGGSAFFVLGTAQEVEPNGTRPTAGVLIAGGSVQGRIDDGDLADVYKVLIPATGTYTFETSGDGGAFCRFALELNTKITLQDAQGAQLDANDDIDPQEGGSLVGNRCSRVRRTLTPGTYYLVVEASGGTNTQSSALHVGRYRLEARFGQ
ncbi:MAG: S8 family serine peptidase [Gemmatimonadales bacterium]